MHVAEILGDAEQQFTATEPELSQGLLAIKREIDQDDELVARLKKKFSIENTTGYHMAAFIDASTPLAIFRRLLVGSEGTLAFISKDSKGHLRHLHTVPTVESEVDRCIECGYCEPVCPSRHLTTTPRQRIILRREMLRQPAGSVVTAALLRGYEYDAIETCAADGSCALACPVGINTGVLMKQFRHAEHNHTEEYVAKKIAENWATAERGTQAALRLNHIATTVYGGALLAEGALTAARVAEICTEHQS
jgi:NAD-dependent dihydropyrimidine dehydrogenase PreA subunit